MMLAFFSIKSYTAKKSVEIPSDDISSVQNATYIIDGQSVTLRNGIAVTKTATGTSATMMTKYFGNEAKSDLDDDGRMDSVFYLTQQTGGSGTFFYIVAALNKKGGYVGSDAVFLGDRIAPQPITIGTQNNPKIIVVNYADRKFGESFAISPSMGKSKWLLLDTKTMRFGEVAVDFEGESR